jgi:hypothetical protein
MKQNKDKYYFEEQAQRILCNKALLKKKLTQEER